MLVHNHYRSDGPSGENQVFALERKLLESRGNDVLVFERHSDELVGLRGTVYGAFSTPWNPFSASRLLTAVENFRPRVIHAHNTFPLISDSIFHAARGLAARVLTLHNYRLFCAAGIPFRENRSCTECLDKHSVAPAIRYGCYRGSRLATIPAAARIALHRSLGTWEREVDAFIALTPFQKERVVHAGLPVDRVHVKPNFFPGKPAMVPWSERHQRVVFAGRLSAEKSVESLVDAWLAWGAAAPELLLLGDGPLRGALEARVNEFGAENVSFAGHVDSSYAHKAIGESQLLVLPSVAYETFGLTVIEAMAQATPVVVSDLGSLPALVEGGGGVTFRANDSGDLLRVIKDLWTDKALLVSRSQLAFKTYEADYSEDANYRVLMDIYEDAMVRLVATER